MVGEMRLVDDRTVHNTPVRLRDRRPARPPRPLFWNEHADLLDRADLVAFLHRPSQGLQAGLLALCRTPAELVCPSALQMASNQLWRGAKTVEMHASALCGS